ncbi:MAG: DUF2079 domain-containing protein [Ktedonobacteraceae bacterium]
MSIVVEQQPPDEQNRGTIAKDAVQKILFSVVAAFHKHRYLIGLMVVYASVLSYLTIQRYNNYLSGYYDLGVFLNPLYNTTYGHFLLQYNVGREMSTLASHQMYILVPLAGLYYLYPSANLVLVLQSVTLALGVIPLYLITKEVVRIKSIPYLPYIIPTLYLLSATVQWTNAYDFHPETLSTTFILFTWYFLLKRKYALAVVGMLLTIACKEDMGFVIGALNIAFLFVYKDRRSRLFVALLAVLSFAISIVEFTVLIPLFSSIHTSYYLIRYSYLGKSYRSIALNLLQHPALLVHSLFLTPDRLDFLFKIFVQTGFVALFSPAILVAAPQFVIDLLAARGSPMHQIIYQYTVEINALLWISAIYGLKNISWLLYKMTRGKTADADFYLKAIVWCVVAVNLLSSVWSGPVLSPRWFSAEFAANPPQRVQLLNQMVARIPSGVSVDASDSIAAHLSNREYIAIFPERCDADYIISDPPAYIVNGARNYNKCMSYVSQHYTFLYRNGGYFIAKKKT